LYSLKKKIDVTSNLTYLLLRFLPIAAASLVSPVILSLSGLADIQLGSAQGPELTSHDNMRGSPQSSPVAGLQQPTYEPVHSKGSSWLECIGCTAGAILVVGLGIYFFGGGSGGNSSAESNSILLEKLTAIMQEIKNTSEASAVSRASSILSSNTTNTDIIVRHVNRVEAVLEKQVELGYFDFKHVFPDSTRRPS
jgi:hypothetical protein